MDAHLIRVIPSRLDVIASDRQTLKRFLEQTRRQKGIFLDLNEAWAGIHHVLTGEPPIPKDKALELGVSWDETSLENVLMGGEPLPSLSSYGPVRYLDNESVKRLAEKLNEVDRTTFEKWFDPEELAEEQIPPGDWNEERRAWLTEYFMKLVDFYKEATAHRDGILIHIV